MIDIRLNLGNHNVLLETNYDLWVFITGPLPTFKWTYRIAHNKDRARAHTNNFHMGYYVKHINNGPAIIIVQALTRSLLCAIL